MKRLLPDLWAIARSTVEHVLIEPVRDGLPQPRTWPAALRWVFWLAAVVIFAMGLLTVLGPQLRSRTTLVPMNFTYSIPAWSIEPLLWVAVFTLTLLFSATLRTHWAMTATAWLVVVPSVILSSAGSGKRGVVLASAMMLFLVVYSWFVRRRPWSIVEVAVVWLALQAAIVVPQTWSESAQFGVDPRTELVLILQVVLSALAAPALAAAGYAGSELITTTAQWLTHDLRQLGTRSPVSVWLLVVVLITGGWRAWTMIVEYASPNPGQLGSLVVSAGALLVTAGVTLVVWQRSWVIRNDRRATWPAGQPSVLSEVWNPWTLWLGIALAFLLWPLGLATGLIALLQVAHLNALQQTMISAQQVMQTPVARDLSRALAAVLVLGVAWRRSRHGNASVVLLAAAALPLWSTAIVGRLVGVPLGWTGPDLLSLVSLAALVWLVVAAVTKKLHNGMLVAIWVIWLIGQLFSFREVLSDPTAVLAQLSPGALVLVGLLWRLVTDGAIAREHSRPFPRTSRILLLLTNTSLGMFVLMLGSLAGGSAPFDNSEAWATLGDEMIGTPLLVAAVLAPFLISFWSKSIDEDRLQVVAPPGMALPVSGVTPWPTELPTRERLVVTPVAALWVPADEPTRKVRRQSPTWPPPIGTPHS